MIEQCGGVEDAIFSRLGVQSLELYYTAEEEEEEGRGKGLIRVTME